jgi:hypothetical protein
MSESTEDRGSGPDGENADAAAAGASDQQGSTGDRHDDDVYEEQQIVHPPDPDQA